LAIKVDIIYNKHIFDALKEIPDNFIDTIVTSPPYWGLRDYGEDTKTQWPDGWYGQLGLEPTLDLYIEHLLQVTKELKRVLKPTGVMFWNHNDCYGGIGNSNWHTIKNPTHKGWAKDGKLGSIPNFYLKKIGIVSKCLALQNFRLILKIVDEQGWILRNIIIWYKPNHMPSSVKDRFTNAYEPVFMLTKRRKYWFDLDAVRVEPKFREVWSRKGASPNTPYEQNNPRKRWGLTKHEIATGRLSASYSDPLHTKPYHIKGKNPGDVWTIATQPFPEAHFATFPEKLVEPMIRCACPKWICKKCGKARVRVTRVEYEGGVPLSGKELTYTDNNFSTRKFKGARGKWFTIGWTDCGCNAGFDTGIVLDPFAGAGTTLVVAKRLGRHYIGIEIKKEYCEMAKRRLEGVVCQEELF